MLDSEGGQMTELVAAGSNRIWVDIENVPQHVQDAFVAIEDERFYEHNGIDLRELYVQVSAELPAALRGQRAPAP